MTDEQPIVTRTAGVPWIKMIRFSDGTEVKLNKSSVVVFCGPNNAGKSAALKDVRLQLTSVSDETLVVKDILLEADFTAEEMLQRLVKTALFIGERYGRKSYQGVGYSLDDTDLAQYSFLQNGRLKGLSTYWAVSMPTEDRITDSNPAKSIAILRAAPTHPIHTLQRDQALAETMSEYFFRAFGQSLLVHLGGGGEVPLYVGRQPSLESSENLTSPGYLERLEAGASPLQDQGDGMRSFVTVMLRARALMLPSILMVDEPEAFLHPPQARLIGEFLVKERRPDLQTFVATHSADVVRGLLSSRDPNLIIVRLDRQTNINKVSVLDNDLALQIANEPLTKYTNILDALFQRRVVACEADADSAFYNLIADSVEPESVRDILFTHGNGKASLAKITKALVALGAVTDVIVDIDVLNDEVVFQTILSALGGDWQSLEEAFRRFKTAVESRQNYLKVGDVKKEVAEALAGLAERDALTMSARKRIGDAIKSSSPWDALKEAGRSAIPAGQSIADFDSVAASRGVGLWIVPVGELESFCKTPKGGHGPTWLRHVVDNYDLSEGRELREARDFMRDVLSRTKDAAA